MKKLSGILVIIATLAILRVPIPVMWRIGILKAITNWLIHPVTITEQDVARMAAERDAERALPYTGRHINYDT